SSGTARTGSLKREATSSADMPTRATFGSGRSTSATGASMPFPARRARRRSPSVTSPAKACDSASTSSATPRAPRSIARSASRIVAPAEMVTAPIRSLMLNATIGSLRAELVPQPVHVPGKLVEAIEFCLDDDRHVGELRTSDDFERPAPRRDWSMSVHGAVVIVQMEAADEGRRLVNEIGPVEVERGRADFQMAGVEQQPHA